MTNTDSQQSHVGIAIMGTGRWGRNLVRNFHSLGVLHSIYDPDPLASMSVLKEYKDIISYESPYQIYQDDDIQAVAIATPAETHFSITREALLAGKHVFVEKPFVLDVNEGLELMDLARQSGRILMVGHIMHYHPAFVRLRQMVQQGELGRINYIYSNRLNLGRVRREENILWSFAPHDISMIMALAGELPESVSAVGGNYLHKMIADVTTSHLNFSSGLKAHIFVSWLHPFKEQKLVVIGDRKMAVFDDTRPWSEKLCLYPHQLGWSGTHPVLHEKEKQRVSIDEREPLYQECLHFLECVRTGEKPMSDGNEALQVLRILLACQRSLDMHGTPVPVEANTPEEQRYYVHPTSVVERGAKIGNGTRIWHFSHILPETSIGKQCNIGQNVSIGPKVTIGNGCKIQNNVSVYQGVTLEDDVFCGPGVVFTNVVNPRAHINRMSEIRKTVIKKGATLGANCTIVCGNSVGRHAFVGAGAVVTRDVPDHALVYGNPARQAGWICVCGHRLTSGLWCQECGATYSEAASGIKHNDR